MIDAEIIEEKRYHWW